MRCSANWVAYNDCVYDPVQAGVATDPNGQSVHYVAPNVTTYGIGSEYSGPTFGELLDQATGDPTGVTATLTESGGVHWQPDTSSSWNGGYDTAAGTDARDTFGGIADMTGVIYCGSAGWYVDLTFTGLDPTKEYIFATSAARCNSGYGDRYTIYSISGTDIFFTNASTTGVNITSESKVWFNTGDNYNQGYVARWTGITAPDGSFTVSATHHPTANSGYKAYAFDVFMLAEFSVSGCTIDADCDDGDLCTGDETCDAGTCMAGTPVVCAPDEVCDPDTGECVAQVTDWIAYNDMNAVGAAGDGNALFVTTYDYTVSAGVLKDFLTGGVLTATVTATTVGGPDPHTDNGGDAAAGTDADDAFGGIVDLQGTNELDDPSWQHTLTFDNLDPTKDYAITLTANRDNPSYANQRYAKVTIEGAEFATNASSSGVVINSNQSVSLCIGYNTVNGYVAKWVGVTSGADGSFSIKSEWDNSLAGTKGYAMTAFKLEQLGAATGCTTDADCDDGNVCTDDFCDTDTGECTNPPNTAPCDDGVACTLGDECSGGICAAGTPDNSLCDDADACNGMETCDSVAGCQPGTPVVCSPGETCDPDTGFCVPSVVDAVCEDFEVGFVGSNVGNHPDRYDAGTGPIATAGGGVGNPASVGLAASGTVFTWTDHEFDWNDPNVAGVNFQMDYQTGSDGQFDDDRCTWNIGGESTSSSDFFGAQLDHLDGGIVTYWRHGTDRIQDQIVALSTLAASAWYRFRVEITKLTPTSASLDVSLTELDANGDPTGVPYTGTVPDTSQWGTGGDRAPNAGYFTATAMSPAFKTHTTSPGNADNACFEIVWAGGPAGAPNQPTLVSPAHGANGVSLNPELRVNVTDPDGDPMDVTFYAANGDGPAPEDFSIVVLPDTQNYSQSYPATFNAQTQWIVNNKDVWNIVFVAHEGDIVQNSAVVSEWNNADTAMSFLEDPVTTGLVDGIPYGIAPGNHDLPSTNYNIYFGDTRFLGRAYYGGPHVAGNNDNNFSLFSGGGMDFIVINFGYDGTPDTAVLSWADGLLSTPSTYSDHRAIVVSHYIMEIGAGASFGTQGQDIYDALSDRPNLFLMLCGHRHGEGLRTDPNLATGDSVCTVLADYQDVGSGGDGWLRIMEFSPANDEIRVYTYNVLSDTFGADVVMAANSTSAPFTLSYDMDGSGPMEIGTVFGVASGDDAFVDWPGLDPGTTYDWFVEINDGTFTTTSPTWTFATICLADADCDDGDLCTTDVCNVDTCEFTPVVCDPGETCNPGTGLCELPPTTVMFQDGLDGYGGTHDTYLQEAVPGNVNGALEGWEWDDDDPNGSGSVNLGVLRFDDIFGAGPGQVPVGAQIVSATLSYTIGGDAGPEGVTAELHEVNVDWDEASASWNTFGGDPGATVGDECDPGVVTSLPASTVGTYDVDVTSSLAAWAGDPNGNLGWITIPPPPGAAGGGAMVRSSEYTGNASERPKLAIGYLPAVPCTDDADCDDGDFCNGLETCDVPSGECQPGTPLVCDDADVCNGTETCDPLTGCQPGTPLDCDDGNVRTDDDCDPATGCMYTFNNNPCEDGDPCTTNDMCVDGVCVGGPPPECDEFLLLAEDFSGYNLGDDPVNWLDTGPNNSLLEVDNFHVLDEAGNRVFATTSTSTNIHSHYVTPESATWSDYVFTGRMTMGDPSAGIGVTFLSDYPNSDSYYRLRRGNFSGGKTFGISWHGTGNGITGGVADTGVYPVADVWYQFHVELTDTGTRTEIRAKVWPEVDPGPTSWQADCYDDNPGRLTAGTVGVWSMGRGDKRWDDFVVSGSRCGGVVTDCDDGDACNGGETCPDGFCVPGTPLVCDDGDACTVDDCDPAIGCVYTPIDPAVDCYDADGCTLDGCDPVDGCTHTSIDPAIDCDDDNACTVESCDPAIGCINTPIDPVIECDDGNACTVEGCDPATGCVNVPVDASVDCDDGNACTIEDCDLVFGCVNLPIDPVVGCDDDNACTVDDCDPILGGTNTPIDPIVACDDGNACTIESCDLGTGCVNTSIYPAIDCDDGDACTDDACDPVLGCVNTSIPDCEPDVRVVPVVSLTDPATTPDTADAIPPPSTAVVTSQAAYWIEIWASDTGVDNTGLTGVYVDVTFCSDTVATDIDHGATFVTFVSGTIEPGGVDQFGGSALPHGGGIEPEWVRVGWIQMNAGAIMRDCEIRLWPSTTGVGAFDRSLMPWDRVELGSVTASTGGGPNEVTYDLDGDGFIGLGDVSLWAVSFDQSVPPAVTEHDFDCDGFVGVGDLSWFATGWMKFVGDPTILYPPCGGGPTKQVAGLTDVEFRLVARMGPSEVEVSMIPPRSSDLCSVSAGDTFFVEVWATDAGK